MKRYTMQSPEFLPGQQWLHNETKETVQILNTALAAYNTLDRWYVKFLNTHSNNPSLMPSETFLTHHSYVQPMKGAYR